MLLGQINGFVWQHMANLPGDKWEHPDELAIRDANFKRIFNRADFFIKI